MITSVSLIIVLALLVTGFNVFLLIKNHNTFDQREIIREAIYHYAITCIEFFEKPKVAYSDMESYERTLLRLYDFGYTRILPSEKFEIIKPYIKERKEGK